MDPFVQLFGYFRVYVHKLNAHPWRQFVLRSKLALPYHPSLAFDNYVGSGDGEFDIELLTNILGDQRMNERTGLTQVLGISEKILPLVADPGI